jgi:hypothetical protein
VAAGVLELEETMIIGPGLQSMAFLSIAIDPNNGFYPPDTHRSDEHDANHWPFILGSNAILRHNSRVPVHTLWVKRLSCLKVSGSALL